MVVAPDEYTKALDKALADLEDRIQRRMLLAADIAGLKETVRVLSSQVPADAERGKRIATLMSLADSVTPTLTDAIRTLLTRVPTNIDRSAHFCTDEFSSYISIGHMFATHQTVNHSKGEYSRGYAHVNSCEGLFSILKRGLTGVYHQVAQHHLHRYLAEFDFRYNRRKITDGERTRDAIRLVAGKRLMLREPSEQMAS